MSLYEYKMTLVSIKLPEETPLFRASRRGMVAAMLRGLRKRAPSVVYLIYTISDPKKRDRDQILRDTYYAVG